jgi:hypothetical protein
MGGIETDETLTVFFDRSPRFLASGSPEMNDGVASEARNVLLGGGPANRITCVYQVRTNKRKQYATTITTIPFFGLPATFKSRVYNSKQTKHNKRNPATAFIVEE